jgi:hypothetical protein
MNGSWRWSPYARHEGAWGVKIQLHTFFISALVGVSGNRFGEETHLMLLPGIEPRFLWRQALSFVNILSYIISYIHCPSCSICIVIILIYILYLQLMFYFYQCLALQCRLAVTPAVIMGSSCSYIWVLWWHLCRNSGSSVRTSRLRCWITRGVHTSWKYYWITIPQGRLLSTAKGCISTDSNWPSNLDRRR